MAALQGGEKGRAPGQSAWQQDFCQRRRGMKQVCAHQEGNKEGSASRPPQPHSCLAANVSAWGSFHLPPCCKIMHMSYHKETSLLNLSPLATIMSRPRRIRRGKTICDGWGALAW